MLPESLAEHFRRPLFEEKAAGLERRRFALSVASAATNVFKKTCLNCKVMPSRMEDRASRAL